jgi:hypothetical protein
MNETSPFGSGKRFALWLNRHHPRLYAELTGTEIPTGLACPNCGDILDGKRRDSLFCSASCQRRFRRSRYNPKQEGHAGYEAIVCVSAGGVDSERRAELQA